MTASDQTYHLINLLPDRSFGVIDRLTGSNKANLALNVSAGGLRNVDLAASLGLHSFYGFTT
jgi:hypothetical protein